MENEEKSEHEWDIFGRIDKLELITGTTKPLLNDTILLADIALILAFGNAIIRYPAGARKLKDAIIGSLKHASLSEESLKSIESILLMLCDEAEQLGK